MAIGKGIDIMNWYLVQYADASGMVYQWTQADSAFDAAADVMIDRGSETMLANDADDDYQSIKVVSKDSWHASSYTMREVASRANCMLGLSDNQWFPWADHSDDYWRE
jgi:hypothetical protein